MEEVIDTYLTEIIILKLNTLPIQIAPEMVDATHKKDEEWNKWLPIKSTVTGLELIALEKEIGHQLPLSYKRFLKHKHFYELFISECSFCEHPIDTWRAKIMEMIFNGYPSEDLIETGRIPFANWSDWGLLCFDTTIESKNNNYPIVLWDHEVYNEFTLQYSDFETMITELAIAHEKQRG